MAESISQTIQLCPLFKGLPEGGRQRLTALARWRDYEVGQEIFTQGQSPPGLFVVQRGRVRVYRLAPSGKEHVLHVCEPPQTFAEVAVLGQFALPACARAIQPTRCVLLPREELLAALAADHGLCLGLLGGLSRWVRHLVGLLEDVVLRDAVGRVARYLLEKAEPGHGADLVVIFRVAKQDVANHLNLTGATLSRALRRLEEAGVIENPDPRTSRLLQPNVLRRISQEGMDAMP